MNLEPRVVAILYKRKGEGGLFRLVSFFVVGSCSCIKPKILFAIYHCRFRIVKMKYSQTASLAALLQAAHLVTAQTPPGSEPSCEGTLGVNYNGTRAVETDEILFPDRKTNLPQVARSAESSPVLIKSQRPPPSPRST